MFIEKDGKKVWDRSKVYGYSDEVMLAGEPEDNKIPIEGCDEDFCFLKLKEMGFPEGYIEEVTYSDIVGGAYLCF